MTASKYVIAGATVVDGTGAPARFDDVYVSEGRIAAVRPASDDHGGLRVLDARGLTLTPGFIDAHSHADGAPFLDEPDTSKILQGVTTEVVGNCGKSFAPRSARNAEMQRSFIARIMKPVDWNGLSYAEFGAAADACGYITNYAPLVGHGALRIAVMGMDDRPPTPPELARMEALLEEALDAGVFGYSSGLIYPPGLYSQTEELIALAKHLRSNTLYATHMRNEGAGLLESICEAVRIGEESGARVQISHHKASGKPHWGATKESVALIAAARARGVDVLCDQYPYVASSTMLTATLPPWFNVGGNDAVLARLCDPDDLARLRRSLLEGEPGWENYVTNCGWDGILIASTGDHRFEGRTLAELAREFGADPFDVLVHVLREQSLRVSMVAFAMHEDDVRRVMQAPETMIGSDSLGPGLGGKPHPRMFGTFPRVLGKYARDEGVLTLENAVYKMTGMCAAHFNIPERGTLAPGKIADFVLFDAATIRDVGDFRDPVHTPQGIAYVIQRGETVVRDGRWSGLKAGTRLRPAA